jgi:hypothetical protein
MTDTTLEIKEMRRRFSNSRLIGSFDEDFVDKRYIFLGFRKNITFFAYFLKLTLRNPIFIYHSNLF